MLLWYSANLAKTANKMSFPFNFEIISKDRHFTSRGSKKLKLSADTAIDSNFHKIYLQVDCCFPFSIIKLLSAVLSEPK